MPEKNAALVGWTQLASGGAARSPRMYWESSGSRSLSAPICRIDHIDLQAQSSKV